MDRKEDYTAVRRIGRYNKRDTHKPHGRAHLEIVKVECQKVAYRYKWISTIENLDLYELILGYSGRGAEILTGHRTFCFTKPECLIEEKKKSQQVHRKKIDEANLKRHKINTNYFNNIVRPLSSGKGKYDYKNEEQQLNQAKDTEPKKTKKHRKDRSRSKTKHKKHRSRSHQKNKRSRSRQKEARRTKERKRHSSSDFEQAPKPKHKKSEKRRRSQESDSSGVVSSSDSES